MKTGKVVWTDGNNIFVIRKGTTSNKKIAPNDWGVVQTYTFSREQWLLATTSKGFGMKAFFALDGSNCMDCRFSGNQGKGGCYTHKFNQYVGFLSMLRTISPSDLTPLNNEKIWDAVEMSINAYVRFGTYGEPSLIPIDLITRMVEVSVSHTGYTHQWSKDWAADYGKYFMASVHDAREADAAAQRQYRSFIALKSSDSADAVQCPASNEAGFKSNCAKCGLCSGMLGKGSKNVKILEH